MPTRMQTQAVQSFSCMGDACPDTCCKGWGMQLTAETVEKYKAEAPELMDAVSSGEAEFIMKRDAATDYCVKFDAGWCGIHKAHGEDFLGDACHFFPRITRALGDVVFTTAALSCPATARAMLYTPDALLPAPRAEIRVPYSLRNYLPDGLSAEDALGVHQQCIALALDASVSAEWSALRLVAVAQALALQPVGAWPGATGFYIRMADGRIPLAELAAADPFNLLHALHGLVHASPGSNVRLKALIGRMAEALEVSFAQGTGEIQLGDNAAAACIKLLQHMRAQEKELQPLLRRYLSAQISQALFPFAGFGADAPERATIIAVRLATLKLALATLGQAPGEAEVVEVVQTLARFTDHLADPELSRRIYHETGWLREARLRGLLGV